MRQEVEIRIPDPVGLYLIEVEDLQMRRWICPALTLLLVLTVLPACGRQTDSEAASSESSTASGTESTAESGPGDTEPAAEWLVNFGSRALYGRTDPSGGDTFDTAEFTRTDEVEEQDAASYAFALTRSAESEYLSVTGTVTLAKDAATLFDFYIEEDEEGGTEEDPYAGTSDANAYLSEMIAANLAETDKSAPPMTLSVNGIDWKYGFAKRTEEEGGSSVLNFYAFSLPEDMVVYINAGAYVSGGDNADEILDKIGEEYTEWLKSLKLGEAEAIPEEQ